MQNKDDSHRPCFALLRRVGTLFAVQLKDILSRHLRATLPEGGSFFSRRCASPPPKGKASEEIAFHNKKGCASIFLIEAQPLFILSFFTAPFLNAISLIYRLIAAYLPFNCKIRTSMRFVIFAKCFRLSRFLNLSAWRNRKSSRRSIFSQNNRILLWKA